jgi:hypothetical protein
LTTDSISKSSLKFAFAKAGSVSNVLYSNSETISASFGRSAVLGLPASLAEAALGEGSAANAALDEIATMNQPDRTVSRRDRIDKTSIRFRPSANHAVHFASKTEQLYQ